MGTVIQLRSPIACCGIVGSVLALQRPVKKVKVKFALEQAMKAQKRSGGIAVIFFNFGARRGWVLRHAPAVYPRERDPVPIV
jgi:hypothetical protein